MFSLKRILCNNSFTSLVSSETLIRGAVEFTDGVLKIEGSVFSNSPNDSICGDVDANTTIHLARGSTVNVAKISATNVIVDSESVVAERIWAEKHLHIGKFAKLRDVQLICRSIFIEPGAIIHNSTITNLDLSSSGEQM